MDEKMLEDFGNKVRRLGDDLLAEVEYLREEYDALFDEDVNRDADWEYEEWLDSLTEIAESLIEEGADLYGIGMKEVR